MAACPLAQSRSSLSIAPVSNTTNTIRIDSGPFAAVIATVAQPWLKGKSHEHTSRYVLRTQGKKSYLRHPLLRSRQVP